MSRTLMFDSKGMEYYPGSAWTAMLFVGGYDFETPPPMVTPGGIVPSRRPGRGSCMHARRSSTDTRGSAGDVHAVDGVGSQYLVAFKDAKGAYLEGDAHYAVTLPPDIPEARFWSMTLYDNQTRSDVQTPQRFPRAGSQSFPTRPPTPTRTDRRPCTSRRPSRKAYRTGIGSRPTRSGASSRVCACTVRWKGSSTRAGRSARSNASKARSDQTAPDGRRSEMADGSVDTPVRDLLEVMTAASIEASGLDARSLMLVRIAALVAVDAPPASYLLNLMAADACWDRRGDGS